MLDLSRKEVRDYVYECVHNVISSANIEYVKWDMNRQLTDIGSVEFTGRQAGELAHRYVLEYMSCKSALLTISQIFCLRTARAVVQDLTLACFTTVRRYGAPMTRMP